MRSLVGIFGLLVFIYMRPHEWLPELANIPFLYIFLGGTLVGMGADIASRETHFVVGPQLGWGIMFTAWCALSLMVRVPDQLGKQLPLLLICFLLYFLIAHSLQRVRSLVRVTLVIFGCGLFVAAACVYQGLQPFECIIVDRMNKHGQGWSSHRLCWKTGEGTPGDATLECMANGRPGVIYRCERPGLFGTTSIGGGRVRYLGVLQDPNECALATVLTVPFAFSFFESKRTARRLLVLLATLVTVAMVNVFTKSRGGQLVFATTLGAYFVRKYGYRKGMVAAACLAVPAVIMGGRSGAEADQSTIDRLQAAAAGIKMMLANPFLGAGYTQFTEHHHLTAHNAYLLAVGETGLPGMVMFVCNLYLAVKIPVTVLQHKLPPGPDAEAVKSLAMALLAAFSGMCLGIFFLSWTYHYVLWIHFGLAGSLYSVVRAKDKKFRIKFSPLEIASITICCILLLMLLTFHIKRKNCW